MIGKKIKMEHFSNVNFNKVKWGRQNEDNIHLKDTTEHSKTGTIWKLSAWLFSCWITNWDINVATFAAKLSMEVKCWVPLRVGFWIAFWAASWVSCTKCWVVLSPALRFGLAHGTILNHSYAGHSFELKLFIYEHEYICIQFKSAVWRREYYTFKCMTH